MKIRRTATGIRVVANSLNSGVSFASSLTAAPRLLWSRVASVVVSIAPALALRNHSAPATSDTVFTPVVKLVSVPEIASRTIDPSAAIVPRPTSVSAGLSIPATA